MSTRKIQEDKKTSEQRMCQSIGHNPPMMQVFENGLYEHTCPDCGNTIQFRVARPTF